MMWFLLSAFVVLGIVAALLMASMWFGDRPSDAEATGEARSDSAGLDRRRRVRRDASSGFPNLHG